MKKLYIDEIFFDAKRGNQAPSPNRYDLGSSFDTVSPMTPSIGVRRSILDIKIAKTKLPGPGTYAPERCHSHLVNNGSTKFGKQVKQALVPALIGTEPGTTTKFPEFT
jgi:hypothetical protein